MLPDFLYHLTSSDCVNTVLHDGLKTGMGDNCNLVNEEFKDKLFLCSYDDIKYWSVLLGKYNTIKVNMSGLNESDFKQVKYNLYSEWVASCDIPANRLSRFVYFVNKSEVMPQLCEESVYALSQLVVLMTRIGTHPDDYKGCEKEINHNVESYLAVAENRLDFTCLLDSYIKKKLCSIGSDGDYTMCDYYCVNKRYNTIHLWEQLPLYDFSSDTMSRMRDSYMKLYKFIKDNFAWAAEIQTGGYTG